MRIVIASRSRVFPTPITGPNRLSKRANNMSLLEMATGEFGSFFNDERFLWIGPFEKELQFGFPGSA
jgi:hypothetical protein